MLNEKMLESLKEKFECNVRNNGIYFDVEGLQFLYADDTIFNLNNNDSIKSTKLYIVENFVEYSTNKMRKK